MRDRKRISIALAVILICSCLWIALLEHPQWVQDPPAAETSLPDVAFIASDVPAGSCLDPDGTFYRCSAHPMDCVVTMGADGLARSVSACDTADCPEPWTERTPFEKC